MSANVVGELSAEEQLSQIKKEYTGLLLQLGEKTYVEEVLKVEKQELIKKIYDCNVRANAVSSKKDVPSLKEIQG